MHDRIPVGHIKPDQSSQGTPWLEPESSRHGVVGESTHPAGLGARKIASKGADTGAAVADLVPATPQCFAFDAQTVRVVGTPAAPLFVGRDVCDALGYAKYRDALAQLEDDERVSSKVDTLGGAQEMTCITESGMYALVFGSRKASAKVFRRWVTSEVLPAIRKTGAYAVPGLPPASYPLARREDAVLEGLREWIHGPAHKALPIVPQPPPKGATVEGAIGKVLHACIRFGYATAIVKAARIAKRCCDLGEFPDLITHVEPQSTGRLLRLFHRYFGQWVLVDDEPGLWISLTPLPGQNRRYYIRQVQQRHMPDKTALALIGGAR